MKNWYRCIPNYTAYQRVIYLLILFFGPRPFHQIWIQDFKPAVLTLVFTVILRETIFKQSISDRSHKRMNRSYMLILKLHPSLLQSDNSWKTAQTHWYEAGDVFPVIWSHVLDQSLQVVILQTNKKIVNRFICYLWWLLTMAKYARGSSRL